MDDPGSAQHIIDAERVFAFGLCGLQGTVQRCRVWWKLLGRYFKSRLRKWKTWLKIFQAGAANRFFLNHWMTTTKAVALPTTTKWMWWPGVVCRTCEHHSRSSKKDILQKQSLHLWYDAAGTTPPKVSHSVSSILLSGLCFQLGIPIPSIQRE